VFVLTLKHYESESDILMEHTLDDIKGKNNAAKEQFIANYIPFIVKTVSKLSSKYIDIKNSDEFCVALIAFNEAIDCYDKEKHNSFIRFSEQVIKRRIIDYIRSNKKNTNVYPFTYFYNKNGNEFENYFFNQDLSYLYESIETKQEIVAFKKQLNKFSITLEELSRCSPKHTDSKKLSIEIAKTLCTSDKMINKLYKTKKIPTEELIKEINISKRTIERNRKFIISVCIILKDNFSTLKEYIDFNDR
jgi:RNA polymerase sigma factor